MTRLSTTIYRRVLPAALFVLGATVPIQGQGRGTLSTAENFRRAPNGEVLARVDAGATFAVVGQDGNWLEVDLTGWMWTRSLQVSEDPGFALVVSEPEGENLRDGPRGAVVGRLGRGTLLDEVSREPGWIQVSRRGFLWAPSVDLGPEAIRSSMGDPEPTRESPAPQAPTPAGPSSSRPGGFTATGERGAAILTAIDGDTLAVTVPNSEVEVTAREGNWVRVRLEGWAWMPDTPMDETGVEGPSLEPDDLARDPAASSGRVVSWRLQFISLEQAEAVRTDFYEGEPFLLARYGGDAGLFVYVAVPTDRLSSVEGLIPLEYLTVTARVRTGASVLTGTPILDLLSFERDRR